MKNFTSLLIASALLVSGTATARELKHNVIPEKDLRTLKIDKQVQPEKIRLSHKLPEGRKSPIKSTPAKVGEYGKIITEAPEGNVEILNRAGSAYYPFYFYIVEIEYDCKVSELVTCDNGDVYLKNPVSMAMTDSYLKGYKEGNQLIFELPQTLATIDYYDEPYDLVATLFQYSEEEDWFYPVNTDDAKDLGLPEVENILVIDINEDGSYSFNGSEEVFGLMYSDEVSWAGYADIKSTWTTFDETPVEMPTDISTTEVAVKHDGLGHFGDIAIDGNDVYLKGLFEDMPEAVIKGTRDGDKITFKSNQYVGMELLNGYFAYFVGGSLEEIYDEEYEYYYNDIIYQDEIVFDYNEDTMTLTTADDNVVVLNASKTDISYLNYYISPVITRQPENLSQTPANPYSLEYYDYTDYYGCSYFYFCLPIENEDGYLLNRSDLYYRVFVDGDEFEFDTMDYIGLTENMTLIPYDYYDVEYYDIQSAGVEHAINLYIFDAEEVGVQLCNIHDGVLLGESEIVTISTDQSGVKKIVAKDSKPIESIRYFNVNGQEVSGNESGFIIKNIRYSDGTQKSIKVMKK